MFPLTSQERERMNKISYGLAIGSTMYGMLCTRLDVSYALSMKSRHQRDSSEGHWAIIKNILKYLRRTNGMFLIYEGEKEFIIKCYNDASFQTNKDYSRSQLGFMFCLNGGVVSRKDSKQDTIVDSTTKVEYITTRACA
ncbi:hypothetical protein GQ457_01G014360 [Hibiscus cannabinus]